MILYRTTTSLLCLRLKGRMVVRGHTDSVSADSTGGGGGVGTKCGLSVL